MGPMLKEVLLGLCPLWGGVSPLAIDTSSWIGKSPEFDSSSPKASATASLFPMHFHPG